MIAPIDGSDPPEPPPTPVSFDFQNQSIRVKASRGYVPRLCAAYARYLWVRQLQPLAISGARAMSRGHGHE